jgi:hypothetical protein
MSTSDQHCSFPLDTIPDPETVRARLGEVLREATLLRSLLRLAEQAKKAQSVRQGGRNHGRHHDRSDV